jgi:hypothetical protein
MPQRWLRWVIWVVLLHLLIACSPSLALPPTAISSVTPTTIPTPTPVPLRLTDLVPDIAATKRLSLHYHWRGMSLNAPHDAFATFDLTQLTFMSSSELAVGGNYTTVQTRTLATELRADQWYQAVQKLQRIELQRGVYTPTFLYSDSYPSLTMIIVTPNHEVVLRSHSQGTQHLPWEVRFDGQSYIVSDPAIFAAWEHCSPALRLDILQEMIAAVE